MFTFINLKTMSMESRQIKIIIVICEMIACVCSPCPTAVSEVRLTHSLHDIIRLYLYTCIISRYSDVQVSQCKSTLQDYSFKFSKYY